jgi:hypothetical protein
MLSRSIMAYYDPIRPSRRHGVTSRGCRLYTPPSLCGSAEATHETFPPFPAVLSLRAADPTPVGSPPPPVVLGQAMTGFLTLGPSRHPRARLCQPSPAGAAHGAASFALCCGPQVCLALLAGSDAGSSLPPLAF